MYKILFLISTVIFLSSCKVKQEKSTASHIQNPILASQEKPDFSIAFGSGNNQKKDNPFWEAISKQQPNIWIWGGDNIYCDTEDMNTLAKCYAVQKNKLDYQNFIKQVPIIGMWDDHDYGVNDGGAAYPQKDASQQLFLDFLDVPKTDSRRQQKGTYHSKTYVVGKHKVKIILLDTRYFRTPLTKDNTTKKRYKPNTYGEGTMLGEAQWKWLENELKTSDAAYNVINSSIQFLSNQHGYEAWGNMPHEVDRMEKIITESNAKGVFILSGDRHISEVSSKQIGTTKYKLVDFTSSGLTHAYYNFKQEENPYRVSKVVHQKSYGLVKFDFENQKVIFEMWGENNKLLEYYTMQY